MDTKLIRRCGLPLALLMVGFMFAGCGDSQDQAADQAEVIEQDAEIEQDEEVIEVVEAITAVEVALIAKVAAIATAVEKTPAAVGAILEKYGMTAEEYEAAAYRIASSPSLSAAYEKARSQ